MFEEFVEEMKKRDIEYIHNDYVKKEQEYKKEIERLNNEIEMKDFDIEVKKREVENRDMYINELEKAYCKELERLKSIINEVREWANKTIFYFDFKEEITKHAFDLLYTKQGQELLEILEKENK